MSGAVVTKVKGLEEAKKAVRSLAESIKNPDDKLMRRLGDAMLEDTARRFMTRGYGTWKPNAPSTIKRKGHSNVLIHTGAMMASTQTVVQGNKVTLTVPYGGKNKSADVPPKHQHGAPHIPQRKIVAVTPQLLERLNIAAKDWVKDLVLAFGKKMTK